MSRSSEVRAVDGTKCWIKNEVVMLHQSSPEVMVISLDALHIFWCKELYIAITLRLRDRWSTRYSSAKDRYIAQKGGAVAEWVRALAWAGDRTVSRPGSSPATVTSLRNFGNSVYPALPVSFGGDTKSRRSLLSGVYARGSKRSHQSALECVTVVDSYHHPL